MLYTHKASCHCGGVQLGLILLDGLVDLRRCDCSMCRRRGAVVASVSLDSIHILKGTDKLSQYQFNTFTAKHFFCKICGIYTHHQRRSNPEQFGVNVACIEGVNPYDLGEIPVMDGINHPADRYDSEFN
ncbi:glutathione-dependent formaldehyde-activating GFA [Shewanella halifaxensis HAW-EB4]|uniref:Glutathione-dependent formaldehyde-activating GFA n=1 Tax=Shewanella halifaxensis (strain HAW-EB4) TaxID=458817 RepID=B0TS65_SHEHH|nr:GFA family protein [Shewanella halifaxensis]ABZ75200.1 glutathione-dependent formaldehyde-activating GFA [Shewanella halifaxensis HAW-EB4]